MRGRALTLRVPYHAPWGWNAEGRRLCVQAKPRLPSLSRPTTYHSDCVFPRWPSFYLSRPVVTDGALSRSTWACAQYCCATGASEPFVSPWGAYHTRHCFSQRTRRNSYVQYVLCFRTFLLCFPVGASDLVRSCEWCKAGRRLRGRPLSYSHRAFLSASRFETEAWVHA